MAAGLNMSCARFILFSISFLQLSQGALLHLSVTPGERSLLATIKGGLRVKRDVCTDGNYTVEEGRKCCLCPAGQKVQQHCTTTPDDTRCIICEDGTYNSFPNSRETCEPCKSCSHHNANLEEAEPCTSAKNTVCRCKEGYYCKMENCKVCHPCETCASTGVKVPCTATNNTVCKDEEKQDNTTAVAVGIAVAVLVLIVAVLVYLFYKNRRRRKGEISQLPTTNGDEAVHLNNISNNAEDFQCLLPEIVQVLGWKDMEDIAIRSGVLEAAIDSCKRNHPQDAEEQTLELLKKWVEKQGSIAPKRLLEILQKTGKKGKYEKVLKILEEGKSGSGNGSA
ncbi:tumor necrosis factor receptor superfamily member 6 [Cololabis saira]|uniref:tumor necrosis factor receptor superfamily member 6 n=1 Tax=Cololabis saira TaxID=129043 RepID=UPI002AD410DA|nr:tumor necrosis factor receptor superfamily member 6 [Cololabis saira]